MNASLTRPARRAACAGAALVLLAAVALTGCAATRSDRVETAADYVRCSIQADYEDMAEVVTEDAKPYCYAMAAAPQPSDPLAQIVNETWEQDSLIIEIGFGGEKPSNFMRISPPADDAPDDVVIETWNKSGDESNGTLTVAEEKGELVITHVDGEPIEEVLAVGSGGL